MSAKVPTEEVPPTAEAATAPAPAEESVVVAPEPATEASTESATAVDEKPAPSKRGRKRNGSGEDAAGTGATVDESVDESVDGVAEAEAKPSTKKKKTTPLSPAATKRKPGRPKKTDKNESGTEDELETELHTRVEALPEDVRAKYGSIVWARMVSYPFWPALIVDPRRINNPGLQASALKELDTKFLVCFYQSRDFYPVLIKNVVVWDDTKFNYREGHPAKDAKAPKRRSSLMAAIELADKDVPLPVDERMDGIMKATPPPEPAPVPVPAKKEKKATTAAAAPANGEKRKPGRPPGSKNKPKTTEAQAAADTESAPTKAKRGRKQKAEEGETAVDDEETEEEVDKRPAAPPTPEEVEEENTTPALSKEEIKAKVASRKAPSKKKTANADDKAAAAATKQSAKTLAKAEAAAKAELDSKRKKEIELVVPQKTVKSADIREATAEAARKKIGGREKPTDKGEYKVGNLVKFAGKMTRLHANESSKNNDELIQMLTGLFEEKLVYRSDMERSGVAAIIAALRKSSNPTVATTASAVRKHLMKVLNDDVTGQEKKNKAESEPEQKPAKKLKTEATADEGTVKADGPVPATAHGDAVSEVKAEQAPAEAFVATPTEVKAEAEPEPAAEQPSVEEQPQPQPQQESTPETEVPPAAPTSAPAVAALFTSPKSDPSGDKGRMMCIDMLKKALAPIGDKSESLALLVEEQVFDRFKESNDDYRACARSITFGLKKSAQVRERLNNGSLHALELAYGFDRIFKEA